MDVIGVVSNHPCEDFKSLDPIDFPFHHWLVTKEAKAGQKKDIRTLLDNTRTKLVIFSWDMQFFSDCLAVCSPVDASTLTMAFCRASRSPGHSAKRMCEESG